MSHRYIEVVKSYFTNLPSSFSHRPYSDILFVSEGVNWVTSWEIREISALLEKLGIVSRHSGSLPLGLPRQSIFFANRYNVMLHPRRYFFGANRIAFPYYHGHPDSGERRFIECYENLKHFHDKVCRIQVTNSRMLDLALSTGIDPAKVLLIPIGINLDFFPRQTPESKKSLRAKYNIPQSAIVIGSFQKDGHGWGDGTAPKLDKGPDVFLDTVMILKKKISELFILISGPARGFVKKGFENLKIPYRHIYMEDYPRIAELYHCLDLYIVASREEGGPKAVLESMACGIPLVTTRVGQAIDLVRHGENGWMVDVDDPEGLAFWAERALCDASGLCEVLESGFRTVHENTYESQLPLWREFFRGLLATL